MDKSMPMYEKLAYTFRKKGNITNWEIQTSTEENADKYEASLTDLRNFVYNKFLSRETLEDPENLKSFIELLTMIDALMPSLTPDP